MVVSLIMLTIARAQVATVVAVLQAAEQQIE
jgi:hypothetical protein